MTTKNFGGKITGLLALTCQADYAAEIGDWVQLSDDYTVVKADGTKPVLGKVSVANKKRISSVMGTSVGNPNIGGEVTVEAPGFFVSIDTAADSIVAGEEVALTATGLVGALAAATNEVQKITISADAAGGTYTITYAGQTTTALAYNAAAATIQAALEALSNIGTGDVVVSGTGLTRTLTAAATFVSTDLAEMTINDSAVTPAAASVTMSTVQQGGAAASGRPLIVGLALTDATDGGSFDLLAR